jgi:Ni/Fe-hydrogenase subunit HybB-like protein
MQPQARAVVEPLPHPAAEPPHRHPEGQLQSQPVGGPLATPLFKLLLAVAVLGLATAAWRFAVGLGRSTALSDGYPWGIWIAFDVVIGTALACGGYAVGFLVYVLNRGRYHPLVRPAVLTSALGYSIAGLSVLIDLGRPWHVWKVPTFFGNWNLRSALLEVALCIMAYTLVAWIELSPAFLERWRTSGREGLRRFAERASPWMDRSLIWILGLGLLLPTMHQSSLGSMMLLTGPRLHPLWSTPLLPLLFLISCLFMGYAVVVLEAVVSSTYFKRPRETPILVTLGRVASWTGLLFVVLRLADLAVRGRLDLLARFDFRGAMFWLENLLLLAAPLLFYGQRGPSLKRLFQGGMLLALAGALYRFDTYLVAFDPGPGWNYFPSPAETVIVAGLLALEAVLYLVLVTKFPILGGAKPAAASAH